MARTLVKAPRKKVSSNSTKETAQRLRLYRKKRNLAASGEPDAGEKSPASPPGHARFVIQKHDATRLHYDLRLEMGGVLKSWAVPKGLPEKTGDRALAIEVEDHPLDYGSFEGVIPAGNYGAGTVMLWDRGAYTVEGGNPERAHQRGSIHFALLGEKCAGEWTLVRMKKSEDDDKVNWLVIKNHDRTRRAAIKKEGRDRSVASGRTLDEIAGATASRKMPKRARRPASPVRSKKKPAEADDSDYVEPMKALGVERVPDGDWQCEVKFDGYRALATLRDGQVELWSRNRNRLTDKYPEIVAALKKLKTPRAVIDGEIVALDPEGRPRFQLLQGLEISPAKRPPLFYYVFDILRHGDTSMIDRPIEERRAALQKLLKKTPAAIRFSPPLEGDPDFLLEQVRQQGFEGIVAKAAGSLYEPGRRSGAWVKCRVAHDQEFVIGGYTPPQGARPYFGALLVGYYEKGKLHYAGKVGTGFDTKRLAALHAAFAKIKSKACPFSDLPLPKKPRFGQGMTAAAMRSVTWLKPQLVCQVRFTEWTREGMLRHPVFLGMRDDKSAADVHREVFSS